MAELSSASSESNSLMKQTGLENNYDNINNNNNNSSAESDTDSGVKRQRLRLSQEHDSYDAEAGIVGPETSLTLSPPGGGGGEKMKIIEEANAHADGDQKAAKKGEDRCTVEMGEESCLFTIMRSMIAEEVRIQFDSLRAEAGLQFSIHKRT